MGPILLIVCLLALSCGLSAPAFAADPIPPLSLTNGASSAAPTTAPAGPLTAPMGLPDLTKRETFSAAMQLVVVLTVLSLAPAILIMMTCFTRIIIVLSLLRQALGTQQLPPNQVLIGLALFMTFLVMRPTWERVNQEALHPYMDGTIQQQEALDKAKAPVREFMIAQIRGEKNDEDVLVFSEFAHEKPATWSDVSMTSLVPGFILSELKTAFSMGFRVYLPFLVIDMVISTVLISMGMMMLPPALISLPFKLLLFVLVDGWRLITSGLMGTFYS
ncbi:MAG TPA: flagellar type III secretion system pore protein FliP [Humisphaera sp.]|nr:flagellar type III secretion system pore protein FliP [Humisphaera sp.]